MKREKDMYRTVVTTVALGLALIGLTARPASAQLMPKAQVANLIAKVENGVDEFRNYLQKGGDNARDTASAAQASGPRTWQGASESQKGTTRNKKEALEDALGQLNRMTKRLRRNV